VAPKSTNSPRDWAATNEQTQLHTDARATHWLTEITTKSTRGEEQGQVHMRLSVLWMNGTGAASTWLTELAAPPNDVEDVPRSARLG
jgi:hypothetical protein